MTIKNLFVPLTNLTATSSCLDTALLVSKYFRAHADILYAKGSTQTALGAAVLAESRLVQEFADMVEKEQKRGEKLARQKFDDLLLQYRIDYRENSLPAELPSAYWRAVETTAVEEIEQHGAAYDLIVVARSDDSIASRPMVEAALFGTGCPVLVAPPMPPKVIGERVLIGWNQGVPAAHAVRYAMPFLEIAARVEIFSVATGAKRGASAQEIARYLAWHGTKAEINSASPDQRSVGETLLSKARDSGADLLVLGAFSQSRIRQLVLGGVTDYVLRHAEIPVLMAH